MTEHPNHQRTRKAERSAGTDDEVLVLNPEAPSSQTTLLAVSGMDCAEEVRMIKDALKGLPGVRNLRVNLLAGKATVQHSDGVSAEDLIGAIQGSGLKAAVAHGRTRDDTPALSKSRTLSVAASAILTALGLTLNWLAPDQEPLALLSFAGAIISGGWLILPKAIGAVRRLSLDMNVLMSIAVLGAAAIGEWGEAAAVVFLFALSELLESLSIARARRAIQSLLDLSPEFALVKRDNEFQEVPVEQVRATEIVAVRSGARVPLDGQVIAGASAVNQAPITGESLPVEKRTGDAVFAGTINGDGSLEVRVTKEFNDTTLARIIYLVEEAQSKKAPSQRFVDVFARYYTPSVMVLALLVFLLPSLLLGDWLVWTYRALVLLVIACPCALVIATPVSIVSGLTAMARRGVLIKGGAFLEAIGKLKALAVDKTGTITEGTPRVAEVAALNGRSEEEVLRVAAGIDAHSTHPLAQAVVEYAQRRGVEFARAVNYRAHSGRGAEGEMNGHRYFVGNHRFTHELAVCSDEIERRLGEIEGKGQSVVVVGHKPHADCPGEVLGIIGVGDVIRSHAASAIRSLHEAGIQRVVMLSGDNQRTVDTIARQVGIDEAHGDLLPDEKIQWVRELISRHKYVGMVGDGVNDAPAMAAASIGIAMAAAGTDTAIETADIALMRDDLSQVAAAVHLGRRTVRIIQTNIAFALAVKAAFLVLAVAGYTSLWLAILADTGATVIVVLNALRLLRRPVEPQVGPNPEIE